MTVYCRFATFQTCKLCNSGVILEVAEQVIKDTIAYDDMLPKRYKHLKPDEWGIELADYFECVAGKHFLALWVVTLKILKRFILSQETLKWG